MSIVVVIFSCPSGAWMTGRLTPAATSSATWVPEVVDPGAGISEVSRAARPRAVLPRLGHPVLAVERLVLHLVAIAVREQQLAALPPDGQRAHSLDDLVGHRDRST